MIEFTLVRSLWRATALLVVALGLTQCATQ